MIGFVGRRRCRFVCPARTVAVVAGGYGLHIAALGGPLRVHGRGYVKYHVVCRLVASRSGCGLVVGDGLVDAWWPRRRRAKITVCDTSRFTLGPDLNPDVSFYRVGCTTRCFP